VIGVPVYLHYCGGQLEKVNYMVKTSGCCEDGDEDSQEDSGCCENEGSYVQNHTDFTLKLVSLFTGHLPRLFVSELFSDYDFSLTQKTIVSLNRIFPPPDQYSESVISTTVLRI
jgi:hypothetical protein